ncbi:YfcE family phosphodiesterase [Candidatus Bathyarchaeota archaeon]|nr:YfcE family phosphodiesterase [Candidatus Bathyarchaeota archaeon]
MRLLIIGDTHIPERASKIPQLILDTIKQNNFDFVLSTGDLTHEGVLEYLKKLGKEVRAVRGNMDYLRFPKIEKLKVESIIIGLIHGDQVFPRGDVSQLTEIATEMNVDVLISGHTHRLSVDEVKLNKKKILLLNPGSATGVWGGGPASYVPSFIIIEVENERKTVHAYELINSKLEKEIYVFE